MEITGSAAFRNAREIYVIDDSKDVRRSLHSLFRSIGIDAQSFGSASDFLDSFGDLRPAPILLDIRMPKIDGLELMTELRRRESTWPVIVMSGHGEIPIAVRAMRLGAVEFLPKPFEFEALTDALDLAFGALGDAVLQQSARDTARAQLARLTVREREVLLMLADGQSNKDVARALELSVRTVEMHRGNAMKKLATTNMIEVVAMIAAAGGKEDAPRDQSSA